MNSVLLHNVKKISVEKRCYTSFYTCTLTVESGRENFEITLYSDEPGTFENIVGMK